MNKKKKHYTKNTTLKKMTKELDSAKRNWKRKKENMKLFWMLSNINKRITLKNYKFLIKN